MIEDVLLQVRKPARYIGREWNLPEKDFEAGEIKFGLCFPDLYEVGMSNLGIRIIYGLLNSSAGIVCERFFSPDYDMECVLRRDNIEIFSLESRKKMRDFDIVGFSLGHELGYTNVLNLLELGNIPFESALRDNNCPLVIAGGPCSLNPEPMHEFFDLFVIGEAEEALPEIIDVYRGLKDKYKSAQISKQDLLFALSKIEGVYVPSFYEADFCTEGGMIEFKPRISGVPPMVRKRFVKDLDNVYFPVEWLVPYIQVVHDRITVEAMRGCPNRCAFCQARAQYFPLRFRSPEKILELASALYKSTGYEEFSLCGLSVSDYPGVEELLKNLVGFFKEEAVSVSLPSIKPKTMVGNLSSLIASVKKTGLTFAPEAATERLRGALNKDFDVAGFWKSLEEAYSCGYRRVKLYFMIGIPSEEEADLDTIVTFAEDVSKLGKKAANRPAQVNVSVNTLIPKPHTQLERAMMPDLESIKYKQDYIRSKVKNRRLEFSFHNRYMSILEGVLSRGDRRLSRVISIAFRKGARFDAWGDYFLFSRWQEAFNECGIDYNFYLKEKTKEEVLPWDIIDTGVSNK